MFLKKIIIFTLLLACSIAQSQPYKNSALPIETRVADLLSRMTVEEKVAQLNNIYLQYILSDKYGSSYKIESRGLGGLSYGRFNDTVPPSEVARQMNLLHREFQKTRLGIPPLIHAEGLHGICGSGFTVFPQSIGLASTWNPLLMEKVAQAIADEAKVVGFRQLLSPVLNLLRDPRWGRAEETYGEDPYLVSKMGVAYAKPIEKSGVITTAKHFELNFTHGGRESNEAHYSERIMREIYFPAYEAIIKEGGCRSIMMAYNAIDGVPCATNKWLMTNVLRNDFGFKGFIVSDYWALDKIESRHHTAENRMMIAANALNAGLDKELPNEDFYNKPLIEAIKNGIVQQSTLDSAVARYLRVKFELGLFENPFCNEQDVEKVIQSKQHLDLAYQSGLESIVLLKNDNKTLPFKKSIKKLLVVGNDVSSYHFGGYSAWNVKGTSLLEGLQKKGKVNGFEVVHLKATDFTFNKYPVVPATNLFHKDQNGKLVNGVKAEYFDNIELSGVPSKTTIEPKIEFFGRAYVDGVREGTEVKKNSVRWTGYFRAPQTYKGKLAFRSSGGVRLKVDDKTIIDQWGNGQLQRTIEPEVAFNFQKDKIYKFEIETYNIATYGLERFFMWDALPYKLSENGKAAELAKSCDAIVFAGFISEGEFSDRGLLNLSPSQEQMIQTLSETGKPMSVVFLAGGVINVSNWVDKVPSIVEAWYPGQFGGDVIADVLFGDYNPGGKLPVNFPVHEAQLPLYYNAKPTGRGFFDYNNMTGFPMFPFGHGLSYTQFEYSNLRFSVDTLKSKDKLFVKVDIKNIGDRRGDEVVQLYLQDEYGSLSRPLMELKGFERISLEKGATKTVEFQLGFDELKMLDAHMKWVVEPGTFEVMIGSSSRDIRMKKKFEVVD